VRPPCAGPRFRGAEIPVGAGALAAFGHFDSVPVIAACETFVPAGSTKSLPFADVLVAVTDDQPTRDGVAEELWGVRGTSPGARLLRSAALDEWVAQQPGEKVQLVRRRVLGCWSRIACSATTTS
jgi:hypothetical protein